MSRYYFILSILSQLFVVQQAVLSQPSFFFFFFVVFLMQMTILVQAVLLDVCAMTSHSYLGSLMPSYILLMVYDTFYCLLCLFQFHESKRDKVWKIQRSRSFLVQGYSSNYCVWMMLIYFLPHKPYYDTQPSLTSDFIGI